MSMIIGYWIFSSGRANYNAKSYQCIFTTEVLLPSAKMISTSVMNSLFSQLMENTINTGCYKNTRYGQSSIFSGTLKSFWFYNPTHPIAAYILKPDAQAYEKHSQQCQVHVLVLNILKPSAVQFQGRAAVHFLRIHLQQFSRLRVVGDEENVLH